MRVRHSIVVTCAVIVSALSLLFLLDHAPTLFSFLDDYYNIKLSYQIAVLGISAVLLILSLYLTGGYSKDYFNITRARGIVSPEPFIGLKPKEGETWVETGSAFTVIISFVTALVVYLQVASEGVELNRLLWAFIIAIPFAALNAFNEEMIFRFPLVTVFQYNGINPRITAIVAGVIFGVPHYFGTPGGFPGVLMAGFLGWLLAKSIIENRGMFWAFTIHFIQDIIIFTLLFSTYR